jgi:hypothetical protein
MDEKNNIVVSRFVIPDFKEENAIKNKENDRDNRSNEFTNESLERSGFFCVINNPNSSVEAFKNLLQKHRGQRSSELDNFKKLFEEKKLQYNDQIKSLQEILKIEKVNLNEYLLENRNIKESEHKDLQKQISYLELEIEKLSKEIAEKKDNSIEERIKEVKKELNGLIETLDEITKKRDEISDRSYHRDKENLDKHVVFWENLSKKYEETLNAISDKSFLLFKNGITPRVAQFFIFTGISATIFAGWLFALFSSVRKIDDEDWLFFILESLYRFGDNIQKDSNISGWKWILLFLSFFLLLQTVITFIGWLCKRLFKVWFKKDENIYDSQEQNSSHNIKELTKDNSFSPNFLALWLHWAPYIFIGSVVYVIIQMGTSIEYLKDLDISLSGQAVGSGLALILGGLGFAYINNIIVPRIKTFKETAAGLSRVKKGLKILIQNIELFLLVIVFIITFIVMYFDNKNDAGALFGFVSISLISGYILGTGMRYKGLYETKKYLENRFILLKKFSYYGNKPFSSLNKLDNGNFSRKFNNLEKELLNLFIVKTKLLNPSLAYPEQFSIVNENQLEKNSTKPKRIFLFYNAKRFFNNLVRKETHNNIQNYTYINKQDTVMFPVQTQKINMLEKERNEKKLEMEVVLESIKEMREGNSQYQKDIRLLEAEILSQVNKCKTNISKAFNSYNETINFHNKTSLEYEIALQNGYDLGYWHLKYATENGLKK